MNDTPMPYAREPRERDEHDGGPDAISRVEPAPANGRPAGTLQGPVTTASDVGRSPSVPLTESDAGTAESTPAPDGEGVPSQPAADLPTGKDAGADRGTGTAPTTVLPESVVEAPDPATQGDEPAAGQRYEQHNHGPGQAYQGGTLYVHNNWNDEYVRELAVPDADFAACTDARYVPPRDIGQLREAERRLARYGVVVLTAPPGSGRRTTALRLLATTVLEPSVPPLHLLDLEPEWSEVRVEQLPKVSGHGYLLDLTELPTKEPSDRMGSRLRDYGRDGLRKGWRLVVLASPQSWRGRWAEAAADFTVPLPSPDARTLAGRELTLRGAGDRAAWLDEEAFADTWGANPPAQEACRLAGIITRVQHTYGQPPDRKLLADAADEFQGWHDHIDDLLNRKPQEQGQPSLLANRATVWAGALLNGGEPGSVLRAADALLKVLAVPRGAKDVLSDATSSRRLGAGRLTQKGGRVFHDEDKHGLPSAILNNLWTEFPTQRALCSDWAVSVASDPDIPEEDARLVTRRLLELATFRHDGAILEALATGLDGVRRQLATEVLTEAALDPHIGVYVRQRLYAWSRKASSPGTLRLVIAVCGGELGRKEPGLALTRLRWATAHTVLGCRDAVRAFRALIVAHPDAVREATRTWFAKSALDQILPVFFAIACSDEGAALLLDGVEDKAGRDQFVHAWQQLLLKEDFRETVDRQLTRWGHLADEGRLPHAKLVDLLADVYEPDVLRSGLNRFYDESPGFLESFWGHVLGEAIQRRRRRRDGAQGPGR
ncbi:hypothetical protein ACF06N_08890 [Streptomyces albidoflavus]